jgi:hypothetical protein
LSETLAAGAPIVDVTCGDVNGDAKTDLVAVTTEPGLEIFLSGRTESEAFHPLQLHPEWVELADLDGDGSPEICVALLGLEAGNVEIWAREGESSASFASLGTLPAPPGGSRGRVRGLLQLREGSAAHDRLLVLSSESGEALLESWDGSADTEAERKPACRSAVRVAGIPVGIAAARCGSEVTCLLCVQRGTGASLLSVAEGKPPRRLLTLEDAPTALVAVDLDGDGDDDLVTADSELRLWINIRGEHFREAGESPYRLDSAAVSLLAGDLDERGS